MLQILQLTKHSPNCLPECQNRLLKWLIVNKIILACKLHLSLDVTDDIDLNFRRSNEVLQIETDMLEKFFRRIEPKESSLWSSETISSTMSPGGLEV